VRGKSQIGELRPSQLMHTFGVGATVELPELTALILGLDEWPQVLCERVSEPRLLAAIRAELGPQVERLLTPPVVPDGENSGVPVAPFPRWLRCPLCNLLAPIDDGLFELKPNAWRPEQTTYVHAGCSKSRGRRAPTAFPARYLIACQDGHLDDFPWVEFLHGSTPCRGTLRLMEVGQGGRAGDVILKCDTCNKQRRLSQAFGAEAAEFLPPTCRGRHPHLGINDRCEQAPVTLILGASNSWFAVQRSALSIPSREGELANAIDEAWTDIEQMPPGPDVLRFALNSVPALRKLRELVDDVGEDTVLQAIEQRRTGEGDGDPSDLRGPEWEVFCEADNAPKTDDFRLREVSVPDGFEHNFTSIVLAERLREVSALRGFTRLNAPDDLGARGGKIADLSRGKPFWLPCSEVRGEGIFIRFDEHAVQLWERNYCDSVTAAQMRAGHRAWRERRNLDPDDGWPGERYVLLHSFAHSLIRELALECGYTASSIRERIYTTDPDDDGRAMAGVLLYTAAPDSEGTLGGLVSLGEPDQFGPLLRQALERAALCSSDPLCSEHDPRTDSSAHSAACHACQFASETSCERGNRFLDRTALVPTLAYGEINFFPATT
jgi:hypothetical protein